MIGFVGFYEVKFMDGSSGVFDFKYTVFTDDGFPLYLVTQDERFYNWFTVIYLQKAEEFNGV